MNRARLTGTIAGYALWFGVLYVLFTWLTFPWSRISDQAIVSASDGGWALGIEDMSSSFFGVQAEGIQLHVAEVAEPEPDPADKATKKPSGLLAFLVGDGVDIDELNLSVPATRIIPTALTLKRLGKEGGPWVGALIESVGKGSLDAELWGGDLALNLEDEKKTLKLALEANEISLEEYVVRTQWLSANPTGKLRSNGNISWHREDPKKSAGGVDLWLDDLIVPGLPVVGEVKFSKSEAHLKVGRGRAEFRDTVFEADEVQAAVEGFVSLSKNFGRSRLALKLKFKVREDLDVLVNAVMMGKTPHKDAQGWYHYQLSGTIDNYRFRRSPAAARRGRGRRANTPDRGVENEDEFEEIEEIEDDAEAKPPNRIERPTANRRDRDELEDERQRLRDERQRRREDRKERREELMRKRRERQGKLNQSGDGRGSPVSDDEAWVVPDNRGVIPPSDNEDESGVEPDGGGVEDDFGDEEEIEEEIEEDGAEEEDDYEEE